MACMGFLDRPGYHRNSKHIDYQQYFAREGLQHGNICMNQVVTFSSRIWIFTFINRKDIQLTFQSTSNVGGGGKIKKKDKK